MSKKCCVPNCNKRRADDTILHVFPHPEKEIDRFNAWKNAIGGHIVSLEPETVFRCRRICHKHFEPHNYTRSNRLSANAVPTLHLSGNIASTERKLLQDITQRLDSNLGVSSPSQPLVQATPPQASTSCILPSKGNIAFTEQQPLQDITQRLDSNLGVSSPSQPLVQATPPQASTSCILPLKDVNSEKKPVIVAPEIAVLDNKIRRLQKERDTAVKKLKKYMKLSENPAFQKALSKFTPTALIFIMLQFREAGKNLVGRRFNKKEKLMSLALYKQGPQAYSWMRKFCVLPSPLTLQRMMKNGCPEK